MPYWLDSTPVANGKSADPTIAMPAMKPTLGVRYTLGTTRVAWPRRMGNMGPSRTPTRETAIPFSMMEGTNQMVDCKLGTKRKSEPSNIHQ